MHEPERTSNRPVVLYLAGLQRSGSTLLADALNTFDGFISVGELHQIWDRGWLENWQTSQGPTFRESRFWTCVLESFSRRSNNRDYTAAAETVRKVKQRRHRIALGSRRPLGALERLYVADFDNLYKAISDVSGAHVIVDAGKWPYHASLMRQSDMTLFKTLHLVRDAHAVAYSHLREKTYQAGLATRKMLRRSPMSTALRWNFQNISLAQLRTNARLSDRSAYARFLYSDFVRNPAKELSTVLTALDIAHQPSDIGRFEAGCFERSPSVAFSGNPNRMDNGPVKIVPDDAWRQEMTAWDKVSVWAITSPARLYLRL